jgi:fumarylacetoacetate (FAA) hydrolase
MKLATLKRGGRDGTLVVVSRDLARCQTVAEIARTLQAGARRLGGDWHRNWRPCMRRSTTAPRAMPSPSTRACAASPLPRAYQWADGSAYVNHVELVRKARGAEMPPEFWTDPLMYQGGSDSFVGPRDPILPRRGLGHRLRGRGRGGHRRRADGRHAGQCEKAIRLLMLVNDVSLRNLIPGELAKGFGFLQSKPASAFSPVAVTPDELGDAWRDGQGPPAAGGGIQRQALSASRTRERTWSSTSRN